jgi:hypothetical protein
MNWRQQPLTPDTAAVLSRLVEPLADYIGATDCPRVTLTAALAILVDSLREIDAEATAYLAPRCQDYAG